MTSPKKVWFSVEMEDIDLVTFEKLDGHSLRDKLLAQCDNPQDLEALRDTLMSVLIHEVAIGSMSVDQLAGIAAHGIIYPSKGFQL